MKFCKLNTLWVFAFQLLVFFSIYTLAQNTNLNKDEFWLNLPESPLRIALTPNGRFFTIGNYSSKEVIKYKFGCVIIKDNRIKIIKRSRWFEVNLLPANLPNQVHAIFFEPSELSDDENFCEKAKLIIIKVRFKDKSEWVAKSAK